MRHGTAALSAAVAAVSLSSAATQNVKKHGVRWQPIVAARTARGSEGEGVGELFFKQLRGLPHAMLIELTATASSIIKYHAENKKRKTERTEGDVFEARRHPHSRPHDCKPAGEAYCTRLHAAGEKARAALGGFVQH